MSQQIYIDIKTGTWGDLADLRVVQGDNAEMLAILAAGDLLPESEIINFANNEGVNVQPCPEY